jgi:hypothetical protein
MDRRSFCSRLIVLGFIGPTCVAGCHSPTPKEIMENQEKCEHEWVTAPSGETRCKKCGAYQSK